MFGFVVLNTGKNRKTVAASVFMNTVLHVTPYAGTASPPDRTTLGTRRELTPVGASLETRAMLVWWSMVLGRRCSDRLSPVPVGDQQPAGTRSRPVCG